LLQQVSLGRIDVRLRGEWISIDPRHGKPTADRRVGQMPHGRIFVRQGSFRAMVEIRKQRAKRRQNPDGNRRLDLADWQSMSGLERWPAARRNGTARESL
jgi:hypothetical protein